MLKIAQLIGDIVLALLAIYYLASCLSSSQKSPWWLPPDDNTPGEPRYPYLSYPFLLLVFFTVMTGICGALDFSLTLKNFIPEEHQTEYRVTLYLVSFFLAYGLIIGAERAATTRRAADRRERYEQQFRLMLHKIVSGIEKTNAQEMQDTVDLLDLELHRAVGKGELSFEDSGRFADPLQLFGTIDLDDDEDRRR